ncbi:MAG: hypothetical protein F9K43_18425 [Bauldia sp.]|nr:MAG: hypothetical protein F9K43_18425 [Bauldia sp.]
MASSGSRPLRRPSPRLTFDDAVEVWKRHWLGEAQHHIAQGFNCNPGRINEVLKEKRHVGSRQAALGRSAS